MNTHWIELLLQWTVMESVEDEKSSKTWKCNLTCRTFCSEDIQSTVHTSYNLNATRVAHARATRVIHAYF